MNTTKKKNTAVWITLGCVLALMLIVSVLENLNLWVPASKLPKVLLPTSQLFTVLKKGAVYSLIAVSMNLLNGFTGLFSLGHAGFMLIGAYTYAIFMTPVANGIKDGVFYRYSKGSLVGFSFPELFNKLFGGGEGTATLSLILGVIAVMLLAGLIAVLIAYLIGLPVLRLKSDYLAIATLGFAEILRAVFQWEDTWEGHEPFWARITNGANMIKAFPTFRDFNITDASGKTVYYFATLFPFIVAAICIALILLLINSTYGRAFKAVRDDETAAEAMGINLASTKRISFCVSAFFAAVGGVLYAMFTTTVQAKPFTSALTYELLLIVVIGGIGSVSGSCVASFLYVACSEWWLRFLDHETTVGNFKVPLLKDGFRMVVFSVVIMIIVLFFQKGIFGDKEFTNIFKRKKKTLVGKEEKKA